MTGAQLRTIETRLLRERERAVRVLDRLREDVSSSLGRGDSGPALIPPDLADFASLLLEREQALGLASREARYLYRIDESLRRLYQEPERFGRCERCGEEIPFPRLEALPHARYCLNCKLGEEAS